MGLRGLVFAKQYPSSLEPVRGTFVARQVAATAPWIDWRVIAPVPWAPRAVSRAVRRPQPPLHEVVAGVDVAHPRYLVGPMRIGYRRAAAAMARGSARAMSEALRGGVDFVHAHGLYPSGCAAAALVRGRVPLVLTLHGSDLYAQLTDERIVEEMSAAARAAARVVCVSAPLADDTARALGLRRDAIAVIPDAYDDDRFAFVERERRAGPAALVSVGRLEPVKGQDVLLEAFAHLVRSGTDATLTLVGDGSRRERLEDMARELGVQDRVRFPGQLVGGALVSALTSADLYVQPSRREGFGVSLVEAMATGLPVVATRSGGPRDIVGASDGILAAPGDADALTTAIAEALGRLPSFDARAIADGVRCRYSRAAVGELLHEFYESVVGAR